MLTVFKAKPLGGYCGVKSCEHAGSDDDVEESMDRGIDSYELSGIKTSAG